MGAMFSTLLANGISAALAYTKGFFVSMGLGSLTPGMQLVILGVGPLFVLGVIGLMVYHAFDFLNSSQALPAPSKAKLRSIPSSFSKRRFDPSPKDLGPNQGNSVDPVSVPEPTNNLKKKEARENIEKDNSSTSSVPSAGREDVQEVPDPIIEQLWPEPRLDLTQAPVPVLPPKKQSPRSRSPDSASGVSLTPKSPSNQNSSQRNDPPAEQKPGQNPELVNSPAQQAAPAASPSSKTEASDTEELVKTPAFQAPLPNEAPSSLGVSTGTDIAATQSVPGSPIPQTKNSPIQDQSQQENLQNMEVLSLPPPAVATNANAASPLPVFVSDRNNILANQKLFVLDFEVLHSEIAEQQASLFYCSDSRVSMKIYQWIRDEWFVLNRNELGSLTNEKKASLTPLDKILYNEYMVSRYAGLFANYNEAGAKPLCSDY